MIQRINILEKFRATLVLLLTAIKIVFASAEIKKKKIQGTTANVVNGI